VLIGKGIRLIDKNRVMERMAPESPSSIGQATDGVLLELCER